MISSITLSSIDFLAATIRIAAPILLVALGAVLSEKSGVMNIATEGMMLVGAFIGMVLAVATNNVWMGVVASIVSGLVCGLVLAILAVTLKANQVVVGISFNIVTLGLTTFFYQAFFTVGQGSMIRTPPFEHWRIPGLSDLPIVGTLLFSQDPLVYIGLALVPILTFLIFHTSLGLTIRAVGESAMAADSAGINVSKVRYLCTILGGAIIGLGGSYLSLNEAHAFLPNMTAGRGFIALAAVIFGKWHPVGALAATLLFGAAGALQFRVQGLGLPIPSLLPTMLPYVLTLVALIGIVGKAIPPADDGRPYIKEE